MKHFHVNNMLNHFFGLYIQASKVTLNTFEDNAFSIRTYYSQSKNFTFSEKKWVETKLLEILAIKIHQHITLKDHALQVHCNHPVKNLSLTCSPKRKRNLTHGKVITSKVKNFP